MKPLGEQKLSRTQYSTRNPISLNDEEGEDIFAHFSLLYCGN